LRWQGYSDGSQLDQARTETLQDENARLRSQSPSFAGDEAILPAFFAMDNIDDYFTFFARSAFGPAPVAGLAHLGCHLGAAVLISVLRVDRKGSSLRF